MSGRAAEWWRESPWQKVSQSNRLKSSVRGGVLRMERRTGRGLESGELSR